MEIYNEDSSENIIIPQIKKDVDDGDNDSDSFCGDNEEAHADVNVSYQCNPSIINIFN